MCTVSYYPASRSNFVITQNRDEHFSRPHALPPQRYETEGIQLIYPKDPTGGGTWMCASAKRVICLLNGAFMPHIFMPPYAKSRGMVVLDSFKFENISHFINQYSLENIEPFTMIWLQKQNVDNRMFRGNRHEWELFELKWDGEQKHLIQHDAGISQIWSSATLYNQFMHENRKTWWNNWLKVNLKTIPDDIIRFHKEGGDGDLRTNICMNRGDIISTVSISSITLTDKLTFFYEDIKLNSNTAISFS